MAPYGLYNCNYNPLIKIIFQSIIIKQAEKTSGFCKNKQKKQVDSAKTSGKNKQNQKSLNSFKTVRFQKDS